MVSYNLFADASQYLTRLRIVTFSSDLITFAMQPRSYLRLSWILTLRHTQSLCIPSAMEEARCIAGSLKSSTPGLNSNRFGLLVLSLIVPPEDEGLRQA